jgi:Ca-activated chloride channel family protein
MISDAWRYELQNSETTRTIEMTERRRRGVGAVSIAFLRTLTTPIAHSNGFRFRHALQVPNRSHHNTRRSFISVLSRRSDGCHLPQGTRKPSAATLEMSNLRGPESCRRRPTATIAAAVLVATLSAPGRASGQQHAYVPPPPPTNKNQGSVLELPRTLGSQGSDSSLMTSRQTSQPLQDLQTPSRALRKHRGYEQVTLTVTDRNGRYVTGLQERDFRIYVDGISRSVKFLRQDRNTPVSVGILADTSGSMHSKIERLRAAIEQFILNLNSRDDVFLLAFSNRAFLLQPFTTNHYLVKSRLGLLHAYGQTALFDAIVDGLFMVENGRYDKKALLVVTDGVDNASGATLEQVIEHARHRAVLIYSIGIGNPNLDGGAGITIGPQMFDALLNRVDTETLTALSTDSGARTFLVRELTDDKLLRQYCETIANELREQYTMGFVAPDPDRVSYRRLRVDLPGKPELSVRVRGGVAVGPGSEYAGPDSGP